MDAPLSQWNSLHMWEGVKYKKANSAPLHSGKKAANSFGELGPKREVILNGLKGPESDFGGSKIRTDS